MKLRQVEVVESMSIHSMHVINVIQEPEPSDCSSAASRTEVEPAYRRVSHTGGRKKHLGGAAPIGGAPISKLY